MNISTAAKTSGLTAKTIRYYESINLITPAQRLHNGYRDYGEKQIRELKFVNHARELGFSLPECQELLELYRNQDRHSADVKSLTQKKIDEIDNKITQLTAVRNSLAQLANCCNGDLQPDCPILDSLAK